MITTQYSSTIEQAIKSDKAIAHHFSTRYQRNRGSQFVRQGVEDAIAGRDFCPDTDNDYWILFYEMGYHTAARIADDWSIHYRHGYGKAVNDLVCNSSIPAHCEGYRDACNDIALKEMAIA